MDMHVPVLAREVIEGLRIRPSGTYVDATVGGGGHAALIAEHLGQARLAANAHARGRLIALDRDTSALARARRRLNDYPNVTFVHSNYSELADVIAALQIDRVDGVLIDAGFSSLQLDDPDRGLSFQTEGPLDMRLDQNGGRTAAEYLSQVPEAELTRVLRTFGDVGPAHRIARAIIARCRRNAMKTTRDLVAAVQEALDFVHGTPDEVRTVFQAVRMAVNDELPSLESGLHAAIKVLRQEGRLAVISFHSGEDRIVKNVFREASRPFQKLLPDGRIASREAAQLRVLTPKPLVPEKSEMAANPRAHSAKLRVAERL